MGEVLVPAQPTGWIYALIPVAILYGVRFYPVHHIGISVRADVYAYEEYDNDYNYYYSGNRDLEIKPVGPA
jgi:hypothetical protein